MDFPLKETMGDSSGTQGKQWGPDVDDDKAGRSQTHVIVDDFAANTTIHGVPRVLDAEKRTVYRILWLLVALVFLAVLIYQASALIVDYSKYQTTTRINLVTKSKLEFPSVTVCNLNMLRRSKLAGLIGILFF